MAQVRFWPRIGRLDPSDSQTEMASVFFINYKRNYVTEESQVQHQCDVHTEVRATIEALDYSTNTTTMREPSRRASPQPDYS